MRKNKINIEEKKSKEYDWRKIIGLLGAIIFLISVFSYLFCSDKEVQYIDTVVRTDKTLNDTLSVFYILSYSTDNEFIVGQPVNIEAYILFNNEEAYNKYKLHTTDVKLFISGTAPSQSSTNWFESSVINIFETTEPLRKELQYPLVIDNHLKGTGDVIFQESGTQEVFVIEGVSKTPISSINISPRTIGYEIKNNKYFILVALFGIILSFYSLIKNKHQL